MTISVKAYPADDKDLAAAARVLMATFGTEPPSETTLHDGTAKRHGDWMTYASLVLALPGALVAFAQIRDMLGSGEKRIALKDRIEPSFETARAKAAEGKSLVLTVGNVTVDLGEAGIDDVLDVLAAYEEEMRETGQ